MIEDFETEEKREKYRKDIVFNKIIIIIVKEV